MFVADSGFAGGAAANRSATSVESRMQVPFLDLKAQNRAPQVEVEDTPYGFRYAGIRSTPNGHAQIRMTIFAMPVMTFVSAVPFGGSCGMFVPIKPEEAPRHAGGDRV